jgi:hypothetical protein
LSCARTHERLCLRRSVNPQDLDEVRDFAQMAEGVARGFVVAAQEVDVEDVLPGASAQGAGFDLAQADVAQGEDAERLEQRAGYVLTLKAIEVLLAPRGIRRW